MEIQNKLIEGHYRKLLNLTPCDEGYNNLKAFCDNLKRRVRQLDGHRKKQNEFGDLLILILMDK